MATSPNATQITPPRVPIIDERTGAVSREWYRWFYSLYNILGNGLGIIPVSSGGTGLSTIPTNGQLLIGNGTGYTLNTLAVGNGISVVNGLGTITLANTGVLSFSGGTTGLTPATATTGAITLAGTLGIANGGTNGSAIPTAYGIAYGTGTAYAFTAAGTTKQALLANTGAAPTWSTLTNGTSILYGDNSGGFSNVTIGTGISFAAGTLSATGLGGTVTSVSGTGTVNGITLTGTVTSSGNLTLGGTLGGIGNSQLTNSTISGVSLGSNLFNLTAGTGVSFSSGTTYNGSAAITITATGSGGTVTSVTGTSPVNVATGTTTPVISLASGYGDTQNPYASKTANYVLAAPNGSAGVPTFRALVAADVPGSALTKTDDTNVTLTLGGSPTTALLNAASLALGWSGQLAVGRGGTGLSAGTSGGIPYFSSTSAMTSSALLAANAIVLGGGAGAAPATTTTGTGVVTALGVNTGTAGAFVVNGGALGTPSSGTVTNLTGTASININGTVGATTPAAGTFTSISDSGNLTFTGTSNRVTGLMNGTVLSRLAFQTSTANAATGLYILPNGTGTVAELRVSASSDPTNASTGALSIVSGTDVRVQSFISGTGTYLPLTFYTSGAEKVRIDTAGNVGIGTSSPNASAILDAQSTTKGVRFPNMTTTQKNAIATPPAGLVVFDTTLSKLCVYSGAAWQTITSI